MIRSLRFKNYLLAFILVFTITGVTAQVGIGTILPKESSILDVDASDKGVLIPRVDIADLTIKAPITGAIVESLLVYNTNTTTGKGFYYWSTDDTEWKKLLTGADGSDNIYTADGTLAGDRTVEFNNNNLVFENNGNAIVQFENNGRLRLREYGGTNFPGTPQNLIGVTTAGNVVELPLQTALQSANQDWYKYNTTNAPTTINDSIWTNGFVGIGTNTPNAPLHIFEATGTAPELVGNRPNGSLILEHDDDGGTSSIVFRSAVNADSDYGYISFEDDGAQGSTAENGLLTIGVQNDVTGTFRDDINIAPSGDLNISIGVNPANPASRADPTYNFNANSFRPVDNNTRNLGGVNSHWRDLYIDREIINEDEGSIDIRLGVNRDYSLTSDAFFPFNNRLRNLGLNNNRWATTFTDVLRYRDAQIDSDRR